MNVRRVLILILAVGLVLAAAAGVALHTLGRTV